jgi:excisionase family DNA binding protein
MVMSSEIPDDEKLLTKGEVAQLCRVDIRTVDRWLTAGKLGCQRTPSGRVLVRKRDVLTFVARAETSPPSSDAATSPDT